MRLALTLAMLATAHLYAGPMDPPAAAAPSNIPGVYKAVTPAPTQAPTPQALAGKRYEIHKDTVALALKGGGAVPLGDMGKFNSAGWNAGLDLVYGASSLVDGVFGVSYASMPYKLTSSAQPMTSLGVGVKAIIKALSDQKLHVNFDGGLGYYFVNVATDRDTGQKDPVTNAPITEVAYKNAGGMGFTLGMMIGFQFTPNLEASVTADATQVSLAGGTSDTPLYLTPSLNLKYTF